ncbi:MAG TPA: methylated-DNA--[protein]-cysteine S-methyltransferase [Thermoplasmata archaeon]|nr:methylated-DNA--[protein]-cysteine S-methyltransferase [Thermoplasmata archaeon]
MEQHVLATQLGNVKIVTDHGRLRELGFTRARATSGGGTRIEKEIREYFDGTRRDLRNIPVDLTDSTPFERRVYEATRRIPFGKVATYGQVAKAIGQPNAQRAVGQALGKNPIVAVIPCHRVVGSDSLGGFTGGLEHKKRLLRLEGVLR